MSFFIFNMLKSLCFASSQNCLSIPLTPCFAVSSQYCQKSAENFIIDHQQYSDWPTRSIIYWNGKPLFTRIPFWKAAGLRVRTQQKHTKCINETSDDSTPLTNEFHELKGESGRSRIRRFMSLILTWSSEFFCDFWWSFFFHPLLFKHLKHLKHLIRFLAEKICFVLPVIFNRPYSAIDYSSAQRWWSIIIDRKLTVCAKAELASLKNILANYDKSRVAPFWFSIACSRRSDSGERCKVKRSVKK